MDITTFATTCLTGYQKNKLLPKILIIIFLLTAFCHSELTFAQESIYISNDILYIDGKAEEAKFTKLDTTKNTEAITILKRIITSFLAEHPERIFAPGICKWLPPDFFLNDRRLWVQKGFPSQMEKKDIKKWLITDDQLLKERIKYFFLKNQQLLPQTSYKKLLDCTNVQEPILEIAVDFLARHKEVLFHNDIKEWLLPDCMQKLKLFEFSGDNEDQFNRANLTDWLDHDFILKTKIWAFLKNNHKKNISGINIQNYKLKPKTLSQIFHILLSNKDTDELNSILVAGELSDQDSEYIPQLIDNLNKEYAAKTWRFWSTSSGNTLTLQGKKHLYLQGSTLVIDSAGLAIPQFTEELAEKLFAFLKNKKGKKISGINMQNWHLNPQTILALFEIILSSESVEKLNIIEIIGKFSTQDSKEITLLTNTFNDLLSHKMWRIWSTYNDNTLALYGKKHLYLEDQTLVIDGAELAKPTFDEEFAEKTATFLNTHPNPIAKLQLKNLRLNGQAIMKLFNTLLTRNNIDQLSSLSIIGNGINDDSSGFITTRIAEFILRCSGLTDIEIYNNTVSNDDFLPIITALSTRDNLCNLDLHGRIINESIARLIAITINRNKNLKSIILHDCIINEEIALMLIDTCMQHTSISFDGINVEEDGFFDLPPITALRAMTQRNSAIRKLLNLAQTERNTGHKIEDLYLALIYGDTDRILSVLGLAGRETITQNEGTLITAIRQEQINLIASLKKIYQQDSSKIPAIPQLYPAPTEAMMKTWMEDCIVIPNITASSSTTSSTSISSNNATNTTNHNISLSLNIPETLNTSTPSSATANTWWLWSWFYPWSKLE